MPVQWSHSQQQGCCLLRCGCRRLLAIPTLQVSVQAGHAAQIIMGAVTIRRLALLTRCSAWPPAGHVTGLVSGSQAAAVRGHSRSAAAAGDQVVCLHSQAAAVQQHQLLPRSCRDSMSASSAVQVVQDRSQHGRSAEARHRARLALLTGAWLASLNMKTSAVRSKAQ